MSQHIGRSNPLAATTFSLLISAANVPITCMRFIDGSGYARNGVTGGYVADAGVSLLACLLLAVLLAGYMRGKSSAAAFRVVP